MFDQAKEDKKSTLSIYWLLCTYIANAFLAYQVSESNDFSFFIFKLEV